MISDCGFSRCFLELYPMIRSATAQDYSQLATIYNHYIVNTHSTFEMNAVSPSEMGNRIERVQTHFNLPWLVIAEDEVPVGYAYATQWKPRSAYAKTTETSIYLHQDHFGKGYGTQLYTALISQLRQLGYHALIGGISLPNEPSIKLHEALGFKAIGSFKEVGYKFDRWIDVGYWQLIL